MRRESKGRAAAEKPGPPEGTGARDRSVAVAGEGDERGGGHGGRRVGGGAGAARVGGHVANVVGTRGRPGRRPSDWVFSP